MPKPAKGPHITYRPGLDGVRALAVIGVFLYHARPYGDGDPWLPGGFLGVDLFFVLSGYLITSILLVEWEHHRRIDLLRFWARRARRLIPALVVVVLGSLLLSAIFARDHLAVTRSDTFSSLFYFNNWHQIAANSSYFVRTGNPSLLQHYWSLAVEEQFYIVWPLLLVPGLIFLGRRWMRVAVAVGIVASTTEMWLLYNGPSSDPSRVYYGTDTRAFLLLMGIELAFFWPYVERIRRSLPLLELLGWVALGITIWLFCHAPRLRPGHLPGRRPRGGVLLCRAHRGGRAPADADREGVRRHPAPLDRRAELRHVPLALADRRAHAAERAAGRDGRSSSRRPLLTVARRGTLVSLRRAADPHRDELQKRLVQLGPGAGRRDRRCGRRRALPRVRHPLRRTEHDERPGPRDDYDNRTTTTTTTTTTHTRTSTTAAEAPPAARAHYLAIGDSVMLGCSSALQRALDYRVRVDASISRQIRDMITEFNRLPHRSDRLPKVVIIQVGNNGPLFYDDLVGPDGARCAAYRTSIVVNVRNDDELGERVEQRDHGLAAAAGAHAHLADWYHHSTNSMLSDGTHPWP